MSPKSILYVGQLWQGSTCKLRLQALQELGHDIAPFDTSPYVGYRNRPLRWLAHRYNIGAPVKAFNRDLVAFAKQWPHKISHVWIDKGKWLQPETLQQLRALTGAVLVHYTPDPQIVFNQSRAFTACVPLYDVLFTTKPFEMDGYGQLGAERLFLIHQSYDRDLLYPRQLDAEQLRRFRSQVCFIGHYESHYAAVVRKAALPGIDFGLWGPGWRRYAKRSPWVRPVLRGDAVWGEDYALALNGADIGLCLLSARYPETTTTRSFEVPGCGTFMLAQRTEAHQKLFEEGREAEFFSSEEEMQDKIHYYLKTPAERERIAAGGYQRCLSSGYSNYHRMQRLLELVDTAAPATAAGRAALA